MDGRKMILWLLAALGAGAAASAQTVTPTPETGVTPWAIALTREEIVPGREAVYQKTGEEIVRAYSEAELPVYWLALQSITGSSHLLSIEGADSFADLDQAGARLAAVLSSHPGIALVRQNLRANLASERTVLAYRREDLSFRLNRIDLAGARMVRVSVFELRPGFEEEYVEAMRARVRSFEQNDLDQPWMVYQVYAGLPLPTFIEFHPMESLGEIDDLLDRGKRGHHPGFETRTLPAPNWSREALLSQNVEIDRVDLEISRPLPAVAPDAGGPAGRGAPSAGPGIARGDIPGAPGRESNRLVLNPRKK